MARRNRTKLVRFTDEEWTHLQHEAWKAGISKEQFIRNAIAGKEISARPPAELATLIRELNAIGNNINQIARIANEKHELSGRELGHIQLLLEKIWGKVLEL